MPDIAQGLRQIAKIKPSFDLDREVMIEAADEIERLRASLKEFTGIPTTRIRIAELEATNAELLAALQRIGHETGETMRATNHGRRGDIANEIAAAALTGGKE